jgi:hypothetical protein
MKMETTETKLSLADRVEKKMALAKWIQELYYQNAKLFMADSRYKSLPQFLQTSGISSTFIALKEALDKNRESRDVKETADKLMSVSKEKTNQKVA